MIQVLDAKLEMKRVVDFLGELVDAFLVDAVLLEQGKIGFLVEQESTCFHFHSVMIDFHIVAIVQNTNHMGVFLVANAAILLQFLTVFVCKTMVFCFCFQNQGGESRFVGQIPPIRLVGNTFETQLVESGDLANAR